MNMFLLQIFDVIPGSGSEIKIAESSPWVYILIIAVSVLLLLGTALLMYYINKKRK